ncbi:hypothetical protein pdam_00007827 [Pocillopora damicornis]|uniref:C-type lectin domain-containing protein n=1 Tax=Pocillopora damicornis TaxID=46731 RepID=A0A3M6TY36_POCDA|nr:hypothetical protein pdam_00007827 [Pocillopora damicornis]
MTWHQAQRFCRRLGGDLVKITSARENEFVLALARKSAPTRKQVWIGLMWTANDFYWSDYSVPVYKAWAPNEPNGKSREPCSNMWTGHTSFMPIRANGYWNDLPCTAPSNLPCGLGGEGWEHKLMHIYKIGGINKVIIANILPQLKSIKKKHSFPVNVVGSWSGEVIRHPRSCVMRLAVF